MPRKKKTIVEETLPDNDNSNGSDDSINDFIVTLSKVHRINGNSRSFCFQSQEPVDEVTIQQQYPNGGKFVVTEYNAMGQTVNTNHIDIEPAPAMVTHVPNGNGHGNLEIQLLRDELNHSRNMVLTLIGGLFNNKQQSTPVTELIAGMQGIKALSGGDKDPVEYLLKGMELQQKSNGGGAVDWKVTALETAKEVLPHVAQAFTMANRPAATTTERQPEMVTVTPETVIRNGIAWLKPQILQGMQPNLAVGMLVQFANSPQYQPLLATAIQGDINTFIAIDTEIANEPYRTWFTTAIQMLKEWYAEQSNPDSDIDGGTGDDTDATDDAPPSAGKPTVKKVS